MPSKKEALRQKWNDAGQDVVVLHAFPRARTTPNPSPFPIKFETYLRMADVNYVMDFKQPMSAKNKSPWMTFNGKDMADSQLCVEHLEKTLKGKDMSAHLTDKERAVARGIRAIVEDHLYFVIVMLRWKYGDLKFVEEKVFPPLGGPKFAQGFILKQIAKKVSKQCDGQGIGRHTREEIVKMGLEDLKSLSDLLGKKTFMMGEKPSTVDCTVFGFLTWLLSFPEDAELVKVMGPKEPMANLRKYYQMMKEKYYPDWDELLYKEESKEKK